MVGPFGGGGEVVGDGGDAEDAAAGGDELSGRVEGGSGVEEGDALRDGVGELDRIVLTIGARVAFGGEDDDDGGIGGDFDLAGLEGTVGAFGHESDRVGVAEREEDLAFRVAEADIVFEDTGLGVLIHHEADEEDAAVINALLLEAL